jgi:hypothetical protein
VALNGGRRTDLLTHRVVLRSGTIRRDLFIDAFRPKVSRSCPLLIEPAE